MGSVSVLAFVDADGPAATALGPRTRAMTATRRMLGCCQTVAHGAPLFGEGAEVGVVVDRDRYL
jgi:hypothetical protein